MFQKRLVINTCTILTFRSSVMFHREILWNSHRHRSQDRERRGQWRYLLWFSLPVVVFRRATGCRHSSWGGHQVDSTSPPHPPPVKHKLFKVGVLKEQTKLTSKGFSGKFPLETLTTVEGHITVVHYSAVKRTSRGGNRRKIVGNLVKHKSALVNQPMKLPYWNLRKR